MWLSVSSSIGTVGLDYDEASPSSMASTAADEDLSDDTSAGPTVTLKRAIDGDTIEISPALDGL